MPSTTNVTAAHVHEIFVAYANSITSAVLALAVILMAAKLGGRIASRIGQPPVLGELIAGVFLGSLDLIGIGGVRTLDANATVEILAQLGIIILLFEVGLESTIRDMLTVGLTAVLVAVLGVLAPFALGWGVSAWMLPDRSVYVHLFLGATLTATSVGITARVLQDLHRAHTMEARVILGAAVIDDVLGLVLLTIVTSAISAANHGSALSYIDIGVTFGNVLVFLFGVVLLGVFLSPHLFRYAARFGGHGVLRVTALCFCLALAYASSLFGLAAIVGAYAAGLILEEAHVQPFAHRNSRTLQQLVHPLSAFLAPVFFVTMGMRVDLTAFTRMDVLGLAALLTLVAIIGKQACAIGAIGRPLDRLSIGIGMMPRGEVGLIFANIGLGLSLAGQPVIDHSLFSAVVMMVIITTLATPPLLKWSLTRDECRS
jgi:Kef-type K+ transport system membrane component KefB